MKSASCITALIVLVVSGVALLRADVPAAKVDKLYDMMKQPFQPSDVGDNLFPVRMELHKNVPANEHADIIAALMERGISTPENNDVIFNALMLAEYIPDSPSWTVKLENAVRAAVHSHNASSRLEAIQILLKHPDAQHREEIIPEIRAILSESDETLRYELMDGLTRSKWPEIRKICEDYIRDNRSDPKYRESILEARWYTDTLDVERVKVLFADDDKPHALKEDLAYIAAHKGQAGYDLSVSKAEMYAKSHQVALDFYRKRPEFDKSVEAVKSNPSVLAKFGEISAADLDDWGSNRGINGEMTWGEYGDYQLNVRGSKLGGTIRVSWRYSNYQFEITKISVLDTDDALHDLWSSVKR